MLLTYDALSLLVKRNHIVAQVDKHMSHMLVHDGVYQYNEIFILLATHTFEYIIVYQNVTFTNEDVMKIYESCNRTTKIILEYVNGSCDMSLLNVFMIVCYHNETEILRFDFPCTYIMFLGNEGLNRRVKIVNNKGLCTNIIVNGHTWTIPNTVALIDTITGFIYHDHIIITKRKYVKWIIIINRIKESCETIDKVIVENGKISTIDEQCIRIQKCISFDCKKIEMSYLASFTILKKEIHEMLGTHDISTIVQTNMYHVPDGFCALVSHTSNYETVKQHMKVLEGIDIIYYASHVVLRILSISDCVNAYDLINKLTKATHIIVDIIKIDVLEETIESIVLMLLNHKTRLNITIIYWNQTIMRTINNNMSIYIVFENMTTRSVSQLLKLYHDDGVNTLHVDIIQPHKYLDVYELICDYKRLTLNIQFMWKHNWSEYLDFCCCYDRTVHLLGSKEFICYDHVMFSKSLRKCNIGMSIFAKLDLRESYITHLVLFGNVHKIDEYIVALFPRGLWLVELVLVKATEYMMDELIKAVRYIPPHISVILNSIDKDIPLNKLKTLTRYVEII